MGKKLKKSTTMQQSAEEGKNYLKRSWGEEKFKRIAKLNNLNDDSAKSEDDGVAKSPEPAVKKAKLSKHTTMIATANESKELLKDIKIDEDAKTRRQSKQINLLTSKPAKLAKHSTMNATIKESEYILKDSKIDQDAKTRNQSKKLTSLIDQKKNKSTKAITKNKRSHLTSEKKKNVKGKQKN